MKQILFYWWLSALIVTVVMVPNYAISHQESFEKMGVVLPRNQMLAPNFILETLDGDTLNLKDFKGKAILLNFWATWCVPCKDELPSMQKLYESLRFDGFEIIAISIDRENKEKIKKYVKKYSLTFPVLLDPSQKVRKNYYIMGLPTSYLIGSDGKLKGFISGARNWGSADSKNMFSDLID